jgi:hypothetical protein
VSARPAAFCTPESRGRRLSRLNRDAVVFRKSDDFAAEYEKRVALAASLLHDPVGASAL